jgi:hypothetical protein
VGRATSSPMPPLRVHSVPVNEGRRAIMRRQRDGSDMSGPDAVYRSVKPRTGRAVSVVLVGIRGASMRPRSEASSEIFGTGLLIVFPQILRTLGGAPRCTTYLAGPRATQPTELPAA